MFKKENTTNWNLIDKIELFARSKPTSKNVWADEWTGLLVQACNILFKYTGFY